MRLTFVLLAAGWIQALPAVAYLASRSRSRAAALVAFGGLISLASNLLGRVLAAEFGNNHLLSYLSSPLTAAAFLEALASWQESFRARRMIRLGIIAFFVAWVTLVASVEDMRNFDLVTGPLYSLTILGAALWTLVHRAARVPTAPVLATDWFWIALGIAVLGGATALSSPIGAILLARDRIDLFGIAWHVRAVLIIGSFGAISWGVYRGPLVSKFSTAP